MDGVIFKINWWLRRKSGLTISFQHYLCFQYHLGLVPKLTHVLLKSFSQTHSLGACNLWVKLSVGFPPLPSCCKTLWRKSFRPDFQDLGRDGWDGTISPTSCECKHFPHLSFWFLAVHYAICLKLWAFPSNLSMHVILVSMYTLQAAMLASKIILWKIAAPLTVICHKAALLTVRILLPHPIPPQAFWEM